MNCKFCGFQLQSDEKFCPFCGREIKDGDILINETAINTTSQHTSDTTLDAGKDRQTTILQSLLFIGIYFAVTSVVAALLQQIIVVIYNKINHITPDMLIDTTTALYKEWEINILTWSNFLMYIILVIVLGILAFKVFKTDLKRYMEEPGKRTKEIFLGTIIVVVLNVISGLIVSVVLMILSNLSIIRPELVGGSSTNQETIIQMLTHSGLFGFMTFFSSIFCAPIIEELIFRKSFFNILKFKKSTIFISALLFGLIHVVSPISNIVIQLITKTPNVYFDNILVELIYFFIYFVMGLCFSGIYYKSKGNLIVVIAIHFLNNLLSIVSILLLI